MLKYKQVSCAFQIRVKIGCFGSSPFSLRCGSCFYIYLIVFKFACCFLLSILIRDVTFLFIINMEVFLAWLLCPMGYLEEDERAARVLTLTWKEKERERTCKSSSAVTIIICQVPPRPFLNICLVNTVLYASVIVSY